METGFIIRKYTVVDPNVMSSPISDLKYGSWILIIVYSLSGLMTRDIKDRHVFDALRIIII